MNHWMEITYDWCISRQLWWGHRIPAWYKGDEVYVGEEAPKEEGWIQDEDVLDTWFSSALWPFSTLGYPNNTEDFKRYFPTDCLVTGYDIIPFWVNRMTFQSLEINGVRPFKDCIVHGLVRDSMGRKMSKSLGNGIDPMDMINEYGADALRYYLVTDCAFGTDLRFDLEKIKSTWNFINKLWNASRFVLMNIESLKTLDFNTLNEADKWILTRYENIVKSTTKHMDNYEFNLVGSEVYNFIWDDFCSNYIEMAKFSLNNISTLSTLYKVLLGILKMMHPFMPFVTEEIYSMLPIKDSESIMISQYPKFEEEYLFDNEEKSVTKLLEFITLFRNKKLENNIGKEFKVKTNNTNKLLLNMLKINDKIIDEELNTSKIDVNLYEISMSIYYDDYGNKAKYLEELNNNKNITAILVQLPLPEHIDKFKVIDEISPKKDVDGLTPYNLGKLFAGEEPYVYPCTPKGILLLLDEYNINIDGKHVVVVGRSNLVGKPVAQMLLKRNATVTMCHSHTKNLPEITKTADIIVSAVGKNVIGEKMLKSNCVVVDVGIYRDENGKVRGDVDFENISKIAAYISPVPGGVGPMTIASLMLNTVELFERNL